MTDSELTFSEAMTLQDRLLAAHPEWGERTIDKGRDYLLYIVDELGEVIAILKKQGEARVMDDPAVRAHFLEEVSDVLMYYTEMLMAYQITPGELARAFRDKHQRNLIRDYESEH